MSSGSESTSSSLIEAPRGAGMRMGSSFEIWTNRQSCGWKFNIQTMGFGEIRQQSTYATQAVHAGVGVQNTELSPAPRAAA
jgi:hypothetical protein